MKRFKIAPKPYEIVPFESTPKRTSLIGHERLLNQLTGKATIHLETLSPLHIGSGIWAVEQDEVIKEFVSADDKIVIPGSSLKGAFRTITETITHSCVCKTSQKNLAMPQLKECQVKDVKGKICPTCSLFGAMGYQGRVHFTDAYLQKGKIAIHHVPALYSPRYYAKVYKNQREKYKGRKFYFHGEQSTGKEPVRVIESGSILKCDLSFENISDNEFSLLLTSLGIIGNLIPKIGGAKPACFGSVKVTLQKLMLRKKDKKSFITYIEKEDVYENEGLLECLKKYEDMTNSLILDKSLAHLKSILKYPSPRKCPDISY